MHLAVVRRSTKALLGVLETLKRWTRYHRPTRLHALSIQLKMGMSEPRPCGTFDQGPFAKQDTREMSLLMTTLPVIIAPYILSSPLDKPESHEKVLKFSFNRSSSTDTTQGLYNMAATMVNYSELRKQYQRRCYAANIVLLYMFMPFLSVFLVSFVAFLSLCASPSLLVPLYS